MMPLQRACGGGSQVRNKLSNGPLRAQSNGFSQSILRRCRQAYKCRGYVGILLKCMGFPVNQGGTADGVDVIRPWQKGIFLSRTFLLFKTSLTGIIS